MNTNETKKNSGFIHIIILVVITVIILSVLGYDPTGIWTQYIMPILNWFWSLFISILDFIIIQVSQLIN